MKLFTTVLAGVLVLGMAVAPKQAQANDVASLLAGLCENVATDNTSRIRKKLKEAGVKLRNIYDGITCGGETLVRYAMVKGANKAGTYIVKRMPASHFATSGDLDWANANGHGGSEIAKAIQDR